MSRVGFNLEGARRIVNATRWVELQPPAKHKDQPPAREYVRPWFRAAITSSTVVVDAPTQYEWEEVYRDGDTYITLPEGRTGTIAEDTFAINDAEINSDTNPVPDGTIVWMTVDFDAAGLALFSFTAANSKGLHQGDIHQMITDEQSAWGPAQFGP
jgi:hypothetical protein